MAVQVEPAVGPVEVEERPRETERRASMTQIGVGLGIALALVVAAWVVGGLSGFESIGDGGVNQRLLPKVGEVAPDFEVWDATGQTTVRLSELRGRPVWLNFWGSWCPPCRAEMPDIQAAWEQLRPEGLVLLAIGVREAPTESLRYALQNGATFPIFSDQFEQEIGDDYPLYNVPTHIFVDADGVVRSVVLADMDKETALEHGRDVIEGSRASGA